MINLEGQRFGRLTAIRRSGTRHKFALWSCKCDCGNVHDVTSVNLRNGSVKSCGCMSSQWTSRSNTTHGHYTGQSMSPTYQSWSNMRQRCYNPNNKGYANYGGRGIRVCDRWLDSFENFLADMGERPPGTSIDRINNDLGYEPNNCVWATRSEQNSNRRRRRKGVYS